ncbi:MAG TPA: TetR/AcrR family transcriptional regulator, partial [Ferruginibacter sp.]|nr:TetR/AcrR family transcriptional regulator [Ferruginibacter sp.]
MNLMIPDTRQRIKTEASLLILKYGLRSMSMDDIATHLGMSKKTIYQHFKDKEELVGDIINDMLKANESDCSCNISDSENAIHEIILAMDMLQGLIPTINPSLLNDLQKYHP